MIMLLLIPLLIPEPLVCLGSQLMIVRKPQGQTVKQHKEEDEAIFTG